MRLRPRGWLVLGAVVVVIVVAGIAVALLRAGPGGCTLAAPVPDLPDRLRTVGDFDRPYEPGDTTSLDDVATRAAAALHHDLIGARPQTAVPVRAEDPGRHDALIVPLSGPGTGGQGVRLAGLVAFLRDCSGRLYYSEVADLAGTSPPLASFPRVSREAAAAALDTAGIELVYRDSPLRPRWRDPATGRELPA